MASHRNVFKMAASRRGERKMAASRRSSPATPKMASSCRVANGADSGGKAATSGPPSALPNAVLGMTSSHNCASTIFSVSSCAAICLHRQSASSGADGSTDAATSWTPGPALVPARISSPIAGRSTARGRSSSSDDVADDGAGIFFLLSCFDMQFHF
ncbi:uncharacterized protein LOC144719785 [Lampetra planeri]